MTGIRFAMQVPYDIDAGSNEGHAESSQQNLVTSQPSQFLLLSSGFLQCDNALEEHVKAKRYEQRMEGE